MTPQILEKVSLEKIKRRPSLSVFLFSFFGPLAVGLITAAMGLGFPPGVLAGVILLFAIALSIPDRLIDWLDEPMRRVNAEEGTDSND